jgi:hypothetical protein
MMIPTTVATGASPNFNRSLMNELNSPNRTTSNQHNDCKLESGKTYRNLLGKHMPDEAALP